MNIQLDRCGINTMEEVRFKDEKASPGGTRVTQGKIYLAVMLMCFILQLSHL